MPSIAVTKHDLQHTGFGEISLIFGKDTINPDINSENKVYSGDAWTPMYPQVEYEADYKKSAALYTRAREAVKDGSIEFFDPVFLYPDNIEDRLNRSKGESGLKADLKKDYGFRNLFLKETTGESVSLKKKESKSVLSQDDIEEYSFLYDQMPQGFDDLQNMSGKDWLAKYGESFRAAREAYIKQFFPDISEEQLDNAIGYEKGFKIVQRARKILDFHENGAETITVQNDIEGTHAEIDSKIDEKAYEKWLDEMLAGIEKNAGIQNGVDPYYSNGDRRSFSATHYTETLENVVRAMKQQRNGESFFPAAGIFGVAAKNYGTFDSMKADSSRIQSLSDEEYDNIKNSFGERFSEIAGNIAENGRQLSDNRYINLDYCFENILDGVRETKTKSGLVRYLKKIYGDVITDSVVNDILDLIADVGNMPTKYFEAKPQRAVGFDEVKAAVVPSSASDEVKTALKNAGITIHEYEKGNEGSRAKATQDAIGTEYTDSSGQKYSDLKFQDRDYLSAVERGDMETAQRMVDDAAQAAGYDLHLYHGSKSGGGFTVFKDWQYFTANQAYAERYTQHDTGKGMYNVYVKASRMFDTRNAEDRALFEQYRSEYGMSNLQDSGLPDWTDGYDLSEIIEENDLDYDGIVLDEGGDLVNGKPVSRGESFVIRNSSQIKSADPVTYDDDGNVIPLSERFKTDNADIRYQDRTDDFDDFSMLGDEWFDGDLFDEQNQRILDRFIDEQPDLALDTMYRAAAESAEKGIKGTKSVQLTDKSYRLIARRLMRDYDISGKANPEFEGDFIKELKTITSNIENGVYKTVEEMSNDLAQRAHDALLFSGHLDYSGIQDELDFIRGKLNGNTLIIPDSAEANIRENYGSVAKYGQRIGARVGLERNLAKKHLTGAQGIYIEDIIAHTEESYRNLITDEADGDQGYVWLDKLLNDTLQPQFVSNTYDKETFDAASAEMAFAIASEIIAEKASQLAADNRAGKKLRDLGYNAKKLRDEQKQKIAEAKKQAIANERQKGKERLKKQHERDMKRKNEQLKKVREKGEQRLIAERERRQNDLRTLRNNRDKRIYIDRIKRLAGEFQQMALHPNDKSYVIPEYLSSGFYEAAQAITDALRLSDSTKAGAALMKLSNTLGQLANEEAYMFEFDEDFRSQVDAFARLLDGKKIDRNLTLREAEDIYRLMREIKDTVKDANKVIRENEGRTVKELGQAVIEDQKSIKPAFFNRHLNGVKNYFMTPERMSNIINGFNDGAVLVGLMNDIKAGYRKKNRFFMEANKMFDEYRNAHVKELDDTEHNVREIAWTDNAGNKRTAKMTGMQAMQLVMTWNREAADDNLNHMTKGSVTIADPEYLAKGKFGKAYDKAIKVYGLNYSFIGAVQGSLTNFERGYIAIAEKLFNEKSTEAINETSLKLKHRQIAKSKYYIPISVIGEEVVKDVDGVKFDSSLENMGMLKSITPHSNKSILICGLDNVINKHIANVSDYYGLAIPIRNLNKVLNVSDTQYDDDGTVINRDTVKSVLRENWGDLGEKVYDQILTDLQGGRAAKGEKFQGANKLIRAIRSNFVTSTLNANKSVVLKQAASYATAQVYLDPSALAGGSVDIRHYIGKGKYKALLDEIDSHTAQHYIRRAGLSSNEIADMQNNWLSAFLSNTSAGRKLTTSKLAQALPGAANPNNWIQEMDCLTTATLWCACKQQVNKDYNKAGKEIDTAAYWQNVTDLYDKVIEDTQPMYDPLHRPEVLKTSNEFIKSVFMFKTQPLQNAGIIYESVGRFAQNKDTASGRQLRKAVTSQTRSLLVFSLMSLAVAFAMHNLKRYKDDDDELTAQSVLSTVFGDMGKNGLGLLLPFGGTEFAEIVSGKYDVFQDNIIEQVNTFVKTGNALVNTIGTEFEKAGMGYDINTDNIVTALEEFAIVAGQDIFGVPIKNVKKNINGYIEWAKDIGNDNELFNTETKDKKKKQIAHSYAKKIESGNASEAEKLLTDFYNEELNKAKSNSRISNPENKASQNTRDMLVNAYKTEYQKAFLKGDSAEMQRIEKILYSANRYMKWGRGSNQVTLNSGNGKQEGKLKQWRKSAKDDVGKKLNTN